MAVVKFQSKELDVFKLEGKAALLSGKIRNMYHKYHIRDGVYYAIPIPLRCIPSAALEVFIKWAEYHKNDDETDALSGREFVKVSDLPYAVELWDLKLMDIDDSLVKALNKLACFLEIRELDILTCHIMNGTFKDKYKELRLKADDVETAEQAESAERLP